jgi:hypothetical protein
MNGKLKIAAILAISSFLVYRTTIATAARDNFDHPEVTAEGVIVHAGMNSQSDSNPELDGVVEGSVTFMANIPFQKVLANCMNPGTLAKISPNVQNVKAVKTHEDEDSATFDVEEEISPLPGFAKTEPAKVYLKFFVNKRAMREGTLAVKFGLDASKPNKWKRLQGRIYAVDLNNGYSTIMVATSSRSHYEGLQSLRLKLVKTYLSKTKDHIVGWLNSIN